MTDDTVNIWISKSTHEFRVEIEKMKRREEQTRIIF